MDISKSTFLKSVEDKITALNNDYYITPLFIDDKPLIGINGLLSSILEAPNTDNSNHYISNEYVNKNNLELHPFKEIKKISIINYSDTSNFMIKGYLDKIFPNDIKDNQVPISLIPKLEEMYKNNELIALSPKTSLGNPTITLNIPCVEIRSNPTILAKDVLESNLREKRNVNRFLEKDDIIYPDNEDLTFNTFLYALYALENEMRFSIEPFKELQNYEQFFPKLNEANEYLKNNVININKGNNLKM